MYRQPGGQVVSVLPNNQLPLLGKHNLHNVLPAVIIGHLLNLETETIATALRQFKTLPHRLELVAERQATQYYNDSLATTPEATISALAVFDRPVVLIAGGWERDQDFTALARTILAKNVVGLVLLQSTGQRLAATLQQIVSVKTTDQPTKLPPMKFAETMAQAVHYAHQLVPSDGGVVLMSPASASFGRFKNYQDRGRQFQEAVKKLV
jgi:UDP-N-acetylmuramoylalanine--D-glutamate ligase